MQYLHMTLIMMLLSAGTGSADVLSDRVKCLAQNIYFEARGESTLGMRAVAWVTMNRVDHAQYPNSICGVVKQSNKDSSGNVKRNQCQFSWYCDGSPDDINNPEQWKISVKLAQRVLTNYRNGIDADPTHQATMFHGKHVSPYWKSKYKQTTTIGHHIFYR